MKSICLIILLVCEFKVSGQIISTIAGNGVSGFGGDGIPATNSPLNGPVDIIFDKNNNMYLSDCGNYRIRKIDAISGIISTIAGTGIAGYSGDGGLATNAQINQPTYMSIDSIGNIFFVDPYNNRIRKIDTSGIISTIAGNGTSGSSGDGGQATNATLFEIYGIANDSHGNLFMASSSGCKIRKVDIVSGIISTIVGTGACGFSGDGGAPVTSTLNYPHDIEFDRQGNYYISDYSNERVRKVDISTNVISTFAGMGAFAYEGDSVPATSTSINPWSTTADFEGNIYVADWGNFRVRIINYLNDSIYTTAGTGTSGFTGDGMSAIIAEIKHPYHVRIDKCGNLCIADGDNRRVRKVTIPQSPPTITITAADDSFCAGNSVTLMSSYTATVSGTAGYQWIVNGSVVSGATNSSYNYNPASGDSVRCVLTFSSNCGGAIVSSNTVNMTLVSSITPTIALPTGILYASAGTVVTVNAVLTDTPISYLIYWFNKGVWFATTTTPWVTYTKTMAIDSISAHIAPSGFCYDSAVSGVEVVIDSVLGVQGIGIGTGVRLYPNPAHDVLVLETNGLQSGLHQWQIMDLLGRGMLQGKVTGNGTEIDIERLPAGVYVVRIDEIVAGRFVKLSEP